MRGCTLALACRQVRAHATEDSSLYLRAASNPIIEFSHGVRFAPYALAYPGVEEVRCAALRRQASLMFCSWVIGAAGACAWMGTAPLALLPRLQRSAADVATAARLSASAQDLAQQGLAEDNGKWAEVQDFGWLRQTPSPNWCAAAASHVLRLHAQSGTREHCWHAQSGTRQHAAVLVVGTLHACGGANLALAGAGAQLMIAAARARPTPGRSCLRSSGNRRQRCHRAAAQQAAPRE